VVSVLAVACQGGASGESGDDADFQDRLLADGVTKEEYLQALEATRECIEAEGWPASPPRPARNGPWYLIDVTDPDPDDGVDPGDAMDRCSAMFLDRVEQGWLRENLVPVEQRAELAEKLRSCLVGVGVHEFPYDPIDPREEPVVQAIVAAGLVEPAFSDAFGCLDRYAMLFPYKFPEP
jgi:hypothetical protein